MDIRCERCEAPLVLDDEHVTEAGLLVRCSRCGHAFRVKKAVAVAGGRRDPERAASWNLRKRNGDVYPFKDLSVLQKWVIERKALRDDEVSSPGRPWTRLAELSELDPFFSLVEQARKAPAASATAGQPAVQPPMMLYPPPPAPETRRQARGEGPVLPGALPAIDPDHWEGPAARGSAREPAWTADAGRRTRQPDRPHRPAERRAVRSGRGASLALLVVLALVGAGAAWLARPAWLGFQEDGPVARAPEAVPAMPAPAPVPVPVRRAKPTATPKPPPSPAGTPLPAAQGEGEKAGPGAGGEKVADASPPASTPLPDPLPAVRGEGETVAAAPAATPNPPSSAAPAEPSQPRPPAPGQDKLGQGSPAVRDERVQASPAGRDERVQGSAPVAPPKARTAQNLIAQGSRLRERGKAQPALEIFNRALDIDESNPDALAGRGLCYLELSQYPEAEASFQAALQAAPENADALMGLAETYRYQGLRPDAVAYYKKYLAAHPDGADAVAATNAIEALKE
jgi:predicted Zn finger-like uncharacterized protein